MKLKILAASIAVISANIYAQSTVSYWDTSSYYRSRTLQSINADQAYARGFTGKGSTIAILDSGIDTKNVAFPAGKISLSKDFTGTGLQDDLGHGTHVAGIAAGARSAVDPIQGVAFDATLLNAKITDTGFITLPTMLSALTWASANGATAANLSASISQPSNLNAVLIAPGVYATTLSNTGQLPAGLNAQQWASALTGQTVLVMAAGNDGAKVPGAQASLATATDSKGNLMLGGRMIIVGSWNEQTNKIDTFSNQAGSLCAVVYAGRCQDKYSVSQFYILAPGNSITSSVPSFVNNSGIYTMSGTSMATPAVSGAIAVLHQQWSQLTGAALVQLVLTTANKNIPGYDPTVMGQGLLDLNKATQPTGGLSFMTAGNVVTGGKTTAATAALITTSGSASTGKISSVMLVDGIGRDYYTAGQNLTSVGSTGVGFNVKQAALPYSSRNGYTQLNNYTDHVASRVGDVEIGLYVDNTMGDPSLAPVMTEVSFYKEMGPTSAKFTAGSFTESNSWLGNSLSQGANSSQTTFAGVGIQHQLDIANQVYATIMSGVTNTGASNTLISSVGPIMSWTWNIGYEHALDEKTTIGIMAYQPPTVYSATATGSIPVGLDANYNVVTAGSVDISASVSEYRFGGYYKLREKNGTSVTAFIENRQNLQGVAGATANVAGVLANVRF
jgi:subtilisin family serine protease